MDQAIATHADIDKGSEWSNAADRAVHLRAGLELLHTLGALRSAQAEADALAFRIDFQHLEGVALANLHRVFRLLDPALGQL